MSRHVCGIELAVGRLFNLGMRAQATNLANGTVAGHDALQQRSAHDACIGERVVEVGKPYRAFKDLTPG